MADDRDRKRCPHGHFWRCKECGMDDSTAAPEPAAATRYRITGPAEGDCEPVPAQPQEAWFEEALRRIPVRDATSAETLELRAALAAVRSAHAAALREKEAETWSEAANELRRVSRADWVGPDKIFMEPAAQAILERGAAAFERRAAAAREGK